MLCAINGPQAILYGKHPGISNSLFPALSDAFPVVSMNCCKPSPRLFNFLGLSGIATPERETLWSKCTPIVCPQNLEYTCLIDRSLHGYSRAFFLCQDM